MWTDRVSLLDDLTVADWLPALVDGTWGTVGGIVPAGYPAYARVLHPVDGATTVPTRWSDVARLTGRQVHPLVQWHRLIGSEDPWNPQSSLWLEGRPNQGSLATVQLLTLCRVLGEHTGNPEECTFALWEGFGQLNEGARMRLTARRAPRLAARLPWPRRGRRRSSDGELVPAVLGEDERRAPRLEMPGRAYLLFGGPLDAMEDVVRYDGGPFSAEQSPNLFWPADRAWCVGTEIDLDSTLVAGDAETIAAVLACPGLEAWSVQVGDSLQFDADAINV